MHILPLKGTESRDLFKFCEISDNMSLMVQDRDIVQWKTNRKSYVAYQIAYSPMPLNDLECQFCCL